MPARFRWLPLDSDRTAKRVNNEDRLLDYLRRTASDLRETRRRLRESERRGQEPVAIVGMACVIPAASPPLRAVDLGGRRHRRGV